MVKYKERGAGVEDPLCVWKMELKGKITSNTKRMASFEPYRPLIAFVENAKTKYKKTTRARRGSTHVAVAANISCLFAFVHTLSAAAKSSVKTIMRQIFNALCPLTKYRTAEGPTNKATVVRTRTRRTTISMRRLLYR